jgi:thioredoxin reductase
LADQPEVVIVGAGPAGIAAAIQLCRYGIPFVILEKERVGGLLWNANLVENYPGFPNGIPGPKLVTLFRKQMERIGVEVVMDEVLTLDVGKKTLVVKARSKSYDPRVVVVASGTSPRPFPLELPVHVRNRVFSTVSPIWNVRRKHVVIIGAGDAAIDYALNLLRHNSVTILNRSQAIQGLPQLWERASASAAFKYCDEIVVTDIARSKTRAGLQLQCASNGAQSTISADYVIFALGREPHMDFLSARIREQQGALLDDGRLYLIGDVKNGMLRQTAIAAGDGLRVAMQVYGARSGR